MARVNKMTGVNKMTWVILFIYSCHLIYWLESFYLLTLVMSFIDSSHFIYWLKSFYLWTSVMSFIDSSHSIYWLVSSYLWLESFYFWSAALRIRNGSPPAYNAIHSCAWGTYKVRRYLDVRLGKVRQKSATTTTALWISQQLMLQSRIGQKEMILWGVIYYRRTALKNLIGFTSLAVKWSWWAGSGFWRRAAAVA